MVDLVNLIPFINKGIHRLKLYGDSNQIGLIDKIKSHGKGQRKSLMALCKNVGKLSIIRRIG